MAEPAKLQWLTLFSCVGMALFGWVFVTQFHAS